MNPIITNKNTSQYIKDYKLSCLILTTKLKAILYKQKYEFSTPYHCTSLKTISTKSKTFKSHRDLFNKTIGVVSNTKAEEVAQEMCKNVFGLIVKPLNSKEVIVEELINENVDLILLEEEVAHEVIRTNESKLQTSFDIPENIPGHSGGSRRIMNSDDSMMRAQETNQINLNHPTALSKQNSKYHVSIQNNAPQRSYFAKLHLP